MGWLIGNKSVSLINQYWSKENPVAKKFHLFGKRDKAFLNIEECQKLHALTFLDEKHPFGKVDMTSVVGMVGYNTDLSEFERRISKSLRIVNKISELSDLTQSAVNCYVPLEKVSDAIELRENGSGKSAHWLKGTLFLSLPMENEYSDYELALNIVHELGHQVLMVYQDSDPLLKNIAEPIFSSVRKTNRPAIMSLHGLVAVYFMLFFLKSLKNQDEEINKYTLEKTKILYTDFVQGAFALRNCEFTPAGLLLFDEMIDFAMTAHDAA